MNGIYDFGMPPMISGTMSTVAPSFNMAPTMNTSIWSLPPATSTTPAPAPQPTPEEIAAAEKERKAIEEMNASGLGLTNEEMEILKGIIDKKSKATPGVREYVMTDGMPMLSTGMFMPMVAGAGKSFGLHHIVEYDGIQRTGSFIKKYSGYEYISNTKAGQITGKVMNYGVDKSQAAARFANIHWGKEGATWTQKLAKGITNGSNGLTQGIIKYGGWTAAATTVIGDVGKLKTAYKKDAKTGLIQTGQTAVKAAGSGVGTWAGAKLGAAGGAKVGGLIGTCFGPAGTAIGAAIGGAIGAIGGAIFGGWAGKKAAKAVVGKDVADKVQQENVAKAGEMTTDENGVKYAQASEEQMAIIQDVVAWSQTQPEGTLNEQEMAVLQKLMGGAA